jgi:hypothetical protein
MRKPYCCEASQHLFNQYYDHQQKGGGDFPVYVGRVRQRGHGVGDIFKNIWKFFFPVLKTLAPHALRAGANIVDDVSSGNSWKDSTFKHGPSVLKQIPAAISAGVAARNSQSGSGVRRKRPTKKRRGKKKRKLDIFS